MINLGLSDSEDFFTFYNIAVMSTENSNNGELFNVSSGILRKEGPQLVIFNKKKQKINKFDDKVCVRRLKVPENADRPELDKCLSLMDMISVPNLNPKF